MVDIAKVTCWAMPSAARTSKAVRRATEELEAPHMPFEEFTVKDIEHLVRYLEKSKPEGAVVDVSAMEGSNHSPCMQEMQAIVVQSVDFEGQPVQTYFMYQYCPACKLAVRVL